MLNMGSFGYSLEFGSDLYHYTEGQASILKPCANININISVLPPFAHQIELLGVLPHCKGFFLFFNS